MSAPAPAPNHAPIRGTTAGANCSDCPFSRDGKPAHAPVRGIGPANPLWIAVGEGPGQNEARTGLPFVGQSGQMVDKALEQVKCRREDVYITNATMCLPTPNATDVQKRLAAAACKPRLEAELAAIPGKPVLALGAIAAGSLITSTLFKITDIAGTHHVMADGRSCIPTVHPAAILRGGAGAKGGHASDLAFWNLLYDVGKVNALAHGRDIILKTDHLRTEVSDQKRAEALILEMCDLAVAAKEITVDLETSTNIPGRSALQAIIAQITAVGLSTPETGVSVLWRLMTPRAISRLRAVLADARIRKNYHNKTYDPTVLRARGFLVRGEQHCTQLMHHAAFPGMAHKLQVVGSQFNGIEPWKSDHRNEVETDENHALYNVKDTYVTANVVAPLTIIIRRTGTEAIYELDREMADYAGQMHLDGIPIDREINRDIQQRLDVVARAAKGKVIAKADSLYDRILDKLAWEQAKTRRKKDEADFNSRAKARREELTKAAAPWGVPLTKWHAPLLPKWQFNLDSSAHIVAFLRAQGVPMMKLTDTGKTSTAADVLESLSNIPEVQDILTYRTYEKLDATFVRSMYDHINEDGKLVYGHVFPDGRIHPRWSPNKITGRWGSEGPGVQNVAEGNEGAADPLERVPNLRRQQLATKGRCIVGFDFAQIEPRIMALLSGDPFLCACFADATRDIHCEFSRVWYPKFDELEFKSTPWTKIRNATKRLEYGAIYGGADEVVWASLIKDYPTMKIADVSVAVRMMKAKLTRLFQWQQEQIRAVAQPPHTLRSLLGRMRVFPTGSAPPTDVVNFRMQATGADVVNTGFSRFMKRVKSVKYYTGPVFPLVHAHDALYFECNEEDADKVEADINDCFAQEHTVDGVSIVFPVECKRGKSIAVASGAKPYYPQEMMAA